MDVLQKIFSGGNPDNHEQRYQNYQAGHSRGSFDDMDDDEVYDRYQRTMQHAPPEVVEDAHVEAFRRLPPEQRAQIVQQFQQASQDPRQPFNYGFSGGDQDYDPRQMARMARQAQQQQPDLLQQVLGPGGALSNPLAKMALAGVTAMAAQKLMGGGPGSGGRGGRII